MLLNFLKLFINFFIFITITSVSFADSINFNGLLISDYWIKETIGNQKITSGYLTIENTNDFDERLVSLSSEISKKTQLHNMVIKNDIMMMKNLTEGLVIKANSRVRLKPGGYHIMFIKLQKPLMVMSEYQVILKFKNSGSLVVAMPVHNKKSNNKTKKHHYH